MRISLVLSLILLSFSAWASHPGRRLLATDSSLATFSDASTPSDLVAAFADSSDDEAAEANSEQESSSVEEAIELELRAQTGGNERLDAELSKPLMPEARPPEDFEDVPTQVEIETQNFHKQQAQRQIEAGQAKVAKTHAVVVVEGSAEVDELNVQVKKDVSFFPKKALQKLSDVELRELCTNLKAATHLGVHSVKGSSAQNFRQEAPLVLRIQNMKSISNVQGKFVALIGNASNVRLKKPSVDHLKEINRPYLVCGVRIKKLHSVKSPLIIVDDDVPKSIRKMKKVRVIAPVKSKKS